MGDDEFEYCCKGCFYKYRAFPGISSRCSSYKHGDKIEVYWNEYEEFYETTVVRDPPPDLVEKAWGNVRLCDPGRKTCRREKCTFAHGTEEQTKWNEILRQLRKRSGQSFYGGSRQFTSLPHALSQRKLHSQANYQPRSTMHQLSRNNNFANFKAANLESMRKNLGRSNYKDKFQNLITSEETTHIDILGEKCNSNCDIIVYTSKPKWIKGGSQRVYGEIQGLNQDIIAYVTQASESAFVKSEKTEVTIEILRENFEHCDESLFIAFEHKNYIKLLNMFSKQNKGSILKNIPVSFKIKQLFFNLLHKSVNAIKPEIIARILPARDNFLPSQKKVRLPSRAKDFDEDQSHALQVILSSDCRSPPILINGSFGTGKTRLIATASFCLLEQAKVPTRILICAHHQATLEDLVDNYLGPAIHQHPTFQLIRVIPKHFRIHESSKYKDCIKFSGQTHYICKHSKPSHVIVLATFLTSLSLTSIGNDFFTHIFMDEGSQAREPEAISSLSLASTNTKIVIAGDEHQVGPALLVLGEEAREYGLKYSLLERLLEHYKKIGGTAMDHIVELKTNYRCSAEIMKLPNQLFYGGKLIANPIGSFGHPDFHYPLVFVCSSLTEEVDRAFEADVLLCELHKHVVRNWPSEWGPQNLSKVSVITASRPQIVLLRHKARTKYRDQMKHVRYLTTFTIQGMEFQALFVSTSEYVNDEGKSTNPTKSPSDRYIFNTVLTRSKSLVVAVGSPLQLLRIESHMTEQHRLCWSLYMKECINNNTFIVPSIVEKSEDVVKKFIEKINIKVTPPSSSGKDLPASVSSTISSRKVQSDAADGNNTVAATSSSPAKYSLRPSIVKSKRTVDKKSPVTTAGQLKTSAAVATTSTHQVRSSNKADSSRKSSSSSSHPAQANYSVDYPVLDGFKTISKRELKALQYEGEKELVKKANKSVSERIIRPHSEFYDKYVSKLESGISILTEDLTPDNYKEKFHHLLCWEEKEHDKQLSERCDGDYNVVIYETDDIPKNLSYEDEEKYLRYGYIDSENGDVLSHAKQASEGSFILLDNGYIHAKHVHASPPFNAHFSAITIALKKIDVEKFKRSKHFSYGRCNFKVEVRFELKHAYFQRLHRAVDHMPYQVILKLNPTVEELSSVRTEKKYFYHSKPPPYECLQLDDMQKKALHVILNSGPEFPILVAGPFGTGKTRMLARAAYDILGKPKSRVLICAHHQASVDTFVDYFGKIMKEELLDIKMVRIIPNSFYRSETHTNYKKYFKTMADITEEMLQTYRLVITTLGIAPRLYYKISGEKYQKSKFFTDILIDEGAQTREPETVGPMGLAGKWTRIIIAGDHCQVGPRLLVLGKNPQKYGLEKSLFERLHHIYDEADLPVNTNSVTLLTNYRCHSGILMLPSSLFYHSTLQCRVSDSESHPMSPFPLNFVCSSMKEDVRNIPGVNTDEIEVLLGEVEKYFRKWPYNWRNGDKRICIMSPSANQCSELKRKLKDRRLDCSIEVLKAYEIQGTEFKAIFVSTSEPTSEKGECKYETKSISDRFVFNTAITRSRALVVAVGNPFLLLQLEKQMVEKYGEEARCWTPYIRQCIECNTFSYSEILRDSVDKQTSKKLFTELYKVETTVIFKPLDSIINTYTKVFEKLKECVIAKKLLLSSKGEKISWKMEECKDQSINTESDSSYVMKEFYECVLEIQNYNKAKAIPVDSSRHVVTIQGLGNRRGAFDGDTVLVGIFEDCPEGECYGKVQEVIERGSNLKFVCRVSKTNPVVFCPIDDKNPCLINLPPLSKDLLKNNDDINETLKSRNVVVFKALQEMDETEAQNISLPQIKQVIPLFVAKNMLFLVSFVKWNPKYRSPLGIVVGVFPKGFTRFDADRLLTFQYDVHYNDDDDYDDAREDHFDNSHSVQENDDVFSQAFTIDPEGAKNLDDALSISTYSTNEDGETVYQLGVHIVNAAKHIEAHSNIDETAKHRGISAYGGKKGKVMHMLDPKKVRSQLSLTPGKVRDVISVTCLFTMKSNYPATVSIQSVDIKEGQIISSMQLTYADAQIILEGTIPEVFVDAANSFVQIPLCHSMKLLYDVAFAMRHRRMQSDAAYVYEVSDPGEERSWQAHLLVEELMIWANSEVAKRIHFCHPDAALLRRQSPPNENKINELVENNRSIMMNSLSLCQYLRSEHEADSTSLLVPIETLQKIIKALQKGELALVMYFLATSKCYPQPAAVQHEIHSICLQAEYCCTEERKQDPSEYHHSGLNLDEYTHFTSPMRRYIDIEVQRMVLESLKKSCIGEFSHEKNRDLCLSLNKKVRSIKLFEKKVDQVDLSLELLSTSKVYTAFIVSDENKFIEIRFPSLKLKNFPKKSLKFVVSNFSLFFRIVSLKHTNMADVLSSHKIKYLNSSDATLGELKAMHASRNSLMETENKGYTTLSLEKHGINSEALAIEIPGDHWKQALGFVKRPLTSLSEPEELVNILKPPFHSNVSTIPSEKFKNEWLYIECKLKDPWKAPGVTKVWLSWSMREHIISPIVQMVEISPLFRFCIQHSSHPAECFSDPNLSHASKKVYESIHEYIELWKKVLVAEAAEKSVKESLPVIIRDVSIEWPELIIPKECISEIYWTPSEDVKICIPRCFVDECWEFFKIKTGYLICLRCEDTSVSGTKAVFHFVVHHINERDREEGEDIIIFMKHIGNMNCRISKEMKTVLASKDCYYEVQIIPMSVSYRRVFGGLLGLSNSQMSSNLSQIVAVDIRNLKDFTPTNNAGRLMDFVDNEFALSISSWSTKCCDKPLYLNKWQEEAVKLSLNKCFQLIQGPPGTGKSETGAHIAYILAVHNQHLFTNEDKHSCVFYCGPSNKSVDVVLEKFSDLFKKHSNVQKFLKILRIYSPSVERKYYPDPSSKAVPLSSAECPEWAKKFALHHLLRDEKNCSEIQELKNLKEIEEKINNIISDKGKIPSGFVIKHHREALEEATKAFVMKNKFDIVFCTCNEASGHRAKLFTVRQCIIDESGMAYEPETIVPLRLCEHAILIGDHKQLQPVIDYGPAKNCGLSKSLFERYAVNYGEQYTYKLRTQYRMHQEICRFPSMHFYEDELETDHSVFARTNPETKIKGFWPRGPAVPIVFVNLVGEEDAIHRRSENEDEKVRLDSKANTKEAEKVVEIARTLHTKHKVPIKEIAVLTPYSAQKDRIKSVIKESPKPLDELCVISINESQGNEFGIVILSTVRSQPISKIRNKHIVQADHIWLREKLGFITDKHQINVGITRSKYGLIIIGNRMLLSYDETWQKLLQHYEENHCIVEGTAFPPA